ncbi:MAG: ATP-binding protein [Magnetovibrio sp.]|nr:ATP-binding protein [Magnetovibrio sp.]
MTAKTERTRAEIPSHLIEMIYRGTPSAIAIHMALSGVLLWVHQDHQQMEGMGLWAAAMALLLALRGGLYLIFRQIKLNYQNLSLWWNLKIGMLFLTGLVWGVAAWVFMPGHAFEHQLFTVMMTIIVAAGAMSYLYPIMLAYVVFVGPMALIVLAKLFMIGSELHMAIAAALVILLSFFMFYTKRHRDELLSNLMLRAENKNLLDHMSAENIAVRSEYDEKAKIEKVLRQKTAVLNAVSQIQSLFIAERKPNDIFNETLEVLVSLTSSEFGFMGEIDHDRDGQPYLRIVAATDISWDPSSALIHEDIVHGTVKFRKLDSLYGSVLRTGEPIIANDAANDRRRGGLPEGHPVISAFLGVPLYLGDKMVGMFGMANREGGYDVKLLSLLEPVIMATAGMMDAVQVKRAREDDQLKIESARVAAEKASQAKTEFLSSMSHELRTPMNAVLGFAQLLQLNPQVPLHPKQADSVEQIIKAGNHLLELINEILDLSRIEAGRVNLSIENIDVHEVIDDCITYISPLAEQLGIALYAGVPRAGEMYVHADRTRFRQVLLNLLSNAVKYNNDNGEVRFSISKAVFGHIRFIVSDTGPGIAKDKQEELFEPFSRLGAEATDIEGTGIGLTISRRLSELMGGGLGFTSKLGKGSEFWIDLPAVDVGANEEERGPGTSDFPKLPTGQHTYLYVEDNPDNLRLMENVISMIDNAHLITAHTGELGVSMATIHKPEAILMDINLPGISGVEALKRLRANEETHNIPIIALSADAMEDDVKRGLAEGFDAYLTKPMNLTQVIEYLRLASEGNLGSEMVRDEYLE